MQYEYLPHTADTKFRAYGNSLEEVFKTSARAMINVMVDVNVVKTKTVKTINAQGKDLQSLLYDFLEKFLIILDSENLFLTRVNQLKITKTDKGYTLIAEAWGDVANKYETIGPQVKAVTYNDMIVEEKMAQVVLDI